MIGRTAGLLVGLPVDLYVGRWRLTARPGIDARRIADLLARDLDALTDVAGDYTGVFKIQAAGPWTLAADLHRQLGGAVLGDHGAVRDLASSLAEGLAAHVAEVSRRIPGARVLLQLDEPSLPAVLAGRVRTESGLYTLRAVAAETARSALREVIDAAGVPVLVHCCAPDAPITLLREAGAVAVALDLAQLGDLDPLGEALDAGMGLFAGVVPTSGGAPSDKAAAEAVLGLWNKLGFPLKQLPGQVVVTPACGLAGASPGYARAATKAVRDAARRLVDAALG
jgi:methionine synthase II (cobalamin-independent)